MDAPTATRPLVDDQRSALASVGAAQARTDGGASEAAEVVLAFSGRCFDGVPKATIRELSLRRRETAQLSLSERVAGRRAGLRVLWVVVDICVLLLARGNRGAAVGRLVRYFLRCDESHRRLGLGSGSGMVKGAVAKGEI
ncbi:hypothetical protein V496_09592 [Pseudogymnoascus sp. VKM F-4515 (FW-2607)]|nr:hypothetical protein V496_09592 [Pseudogymnoascus sp. VKM F-4515 (FW-2607)]